MKNRKRLTGLGNRCLESRMRDFRDGLLSQKMIVSDICWYNSVPSVTIDSFNAILARKIWIVGGFTLIMCKVISNDVAWSNWDARKQRLSFRWNFAQLCETKRHLRKRSELFCPRSDWLTVRCHFAITSRDGRDENATVRRKTVFYTWNYA